MELNRPEPGFGHANVRDLPGWDVVDSVSELSGKPGKYAWVHLDGERPALGRTADGYLYAFDRPEALSPVAPFPKLVDRWALVLGSEDGIEVWVPPAAYGYVALILDQAVDPTFPFAKPEGWVPVNDVLHNRPSGR